MTKPVIIIGCPYTNMEGLTESVNKMTENIILTNINDIESITINSLKIKGAKSPVSLADIHCAFIRYPYDLIPPNSGTYELREKTEFFKTVSLMLEHCTINPIEKCWQLRNRLYSLSLARGNGINVPSSQIVTKGIEIFQLGDVFFVKAMGNCFVSEKDTEIDTQLKMFLQREEDDGDVAWIFPAQKLNVDLLAKYIESVGYGFIQNIVNNLKEYRAYIIDNDFFVYCREEIEQDDKSKAAYGLVKKSLDSSYVKMLKNFNQKLGLTFLCMDIIESDEGLFLIDINPFGSLPPYSALPETTDALAKLIIERAKQKLKYLKND